MQIDITWVSVLTFIMAVVNMAASMFGDDLGPTGLKIAVFIAGLISLALSVFFGVSTQARAAVARRMIGQGVSPAFSFAGYGMGHFVELCKICGAVINQCRCADPNKEKRYSVCLSCLKKQQQEQSTAQVDE